MKKDIKIDIIGAYGSKNIGDDLLMKIVYDIIVDNLDVSELNIYSKDLSYPAILCPKAKVKNILEKPNGDIAIFGGGTQFFSFIKQNAILSLVKHIVKYRFPAVRNYHGKSVYLGIGIGPFINNLEAILNVKFLMNRASKVWFRDSPSIKKSLYWKNSSNFELGADLCYTNKFIAEYITPNKLDSKNNKVALIHRNWPYSSRGNAYSTEIINLVRKLKLDNVKVEIICLHKSDMSILPNEVELQELKIYEWDPTINIANFLKNLSSYKAIISSRYHGIVLGSLLEVPCVSINIEPKLEIVSNQLNIPLWKNPEDDIYKIVNMVVNNKVPINWSEKIVEQKQRAESMKNDFINFIKNLDLQN